MLRNPLAALLLLLAPFASAHAQSVVLNDMSTYPAARIGINIGGQDYYSSYLLSNLVANNAGLQPELVAQQVTVRSGTRDSFTDDNSWTGVPENFFAGGTFQVLCHGGQISQGKQICTGGAGPAVASVIPGTPGSVGCTGAIKSNTAAIGGQRGATYVLETSCPAALAARDQVVIYAPRRAGANCGFKFDCFGWNATRAGEGAVSIDRSPGDFPPPPFSGIQVIKLDTSAGGGSMAGIQTYFDSGMPNYFFSGSYTQGIMVKVISGSDLTLTMSGSRAGSGARWSTTIRPASSSWTKMAATFTVDPQESPTSIPSNAMQIYYTLSGTGSVLIAAPTLISTADMGNGTLYTTALLKTLKFWRPGSCRYWAGQNAETLDNLLAPQESRFTASVYVGTSGPLMQQGLHDFLTMAKAGGCESVSIAMPITWRWNVDAQHMVDYMNGGPGTAYGAKRIALGQAAGWPKVFKRIVLDYGNEVWNPGAGNEAMVAYSVGSNAFWNYVPLVIQFCGAMKHDQNFARNMYCGAAEQTANWSGGTKVLAGMDTNKYVDLAALNEYGQFNVANTTGNNQFISAAVEAWQNVNDPKSQFGFYQSNSVGKQGAVYEYNNSTNAGSITQAEINGYPEGQYYGLVDILMPLGANRKFGILDNDFFTLYQNFTSIKTSGGATKIHEWGAFTGPGGLFNNPRPLAYAISMVNNCIGSGDTGFAVTPRNIPTFSFSGYNGVNAEPAVPYLEFYAFKTGSNRCLVVTNIDPDKSYRFTVSGTNSPAGAVTEVLYTSSDLRANNEEPNHPPAVTLSTNSVSNPESFTIPAHSAMTISYSAGSARQSSANARVRR